MKSQCILLVFPIAILMASCSPVLYTPVGQNVPLFKEKGEATIEAGYCSSNNDAAIFGDAPANGFNVQGGTCC